MVKIGKTDIETKKLGLGTNKVGGHNLFSDITDENGYELLKEALYSGINFLDTAYAYGLGRSEEIIGDVIQNYDRLKIILATKGAQDPDKNGEINNDPEFLKKAVKSALKRLQTDYIDIFYIHFPDQDTPKDKAVAALNDLKQQGLIKAIGISNFSLAQIKEANKNNQVDVVENKYSLLDRQDEKTLMPYLKQHQISFVPYLPLASGLLTGKYTNNDLNKFNASDGGKIFGKLSPDQFAKAIAGVEKVKNIAAKHNASTTQTILAWYMANPDISVVIPGARNAKQAKSTADSLKVKLTSGEYKDIDQAFSGF